MTREEAKKFLPLLQAYADGKEIEILDDGVWGKISSPGFTSGPERYRIKPEPREVWVNQFAATGIRLRSAAFATEASAKAAMEDGWETVHYREVIE